jgi:glutathione S-transferase
MKLYTHPLSSNGRKVIITANLLNLPLTALTVDLFGGAQQHPDFLALNPNGMVPVLDDDGYLLWESEAIMQYLAAKQPGNSLFPDDARARIEVVRWQCWSLAHWKLAIQTLVFERAIKTRLGLGDPDPAEIDKADQRFHRFAKVLEGTLAERRWVAGDTLTLADISIGASLMHAELGQLPLAEYPAIDRWFERVEALPAWQATQPPVPSADS